MTKTTNLGHEIVAQIAEMNFQGNIVPMTWFQHIRFENGKPDPIAIMLLSDIVYWYRPKEKRDEETGKSAGLRKRFRSDLLQKSYQSYADLFGFTKGQIIDAMKRLENLGVIKRHFRNVRACTGNLPNVLFIELIPQVLRRFTQAKVIETGGCPDQTTPLPSLNQTPPPIDPGTNTEITTKINTETHTENYKESAAEFKNQNVKTISQMLEIWQQEIEPDEPVRRYTDTRAKRLHDLFTQEFKQDINVWQDFCKRISGSDFLMGRSRSNWKVTLDWILVPANFTKIVEGNYDGKGESHARIESNLEKITTELSNTIADETQPQLWRNVLKTLRQTMSDAQIKYWILPLEPLALDTPDIRLSCHSKFICQYVRTHYEHLVLEAFRTQDPAIQSVEVRPRS